MKREQQKFNEQRFIERELVMSKQQSSVVVDFTEMQDSKILEEMNRRMSEAGIKDTTSNRIRTLGGMNIRIKKIQTLLQLDHFQHAYAVLRKSGLIEVKAPRTKVGNCIDCGKPIYTDEAQRSERGLICRSRNHTDVQVEEEVAAE